MDHKYINLNAWKEFTKELKTGKNKVGARRRAFSA